MRVFSFELYSSVILLIPWIIVEWSRPPNKAPMEAKGVFVNVLHKYMAICLGLAMSLLLFLEIICSNEIWQCSDTASIISWGVISFGLSGVIIFCSSFIAISSVISVLTRLPNAKSLFNAPSSSGYWILCGWQCSLGCRRRVPSHLLLLYAAK